MARTKLELVAKDLNRSLSESLGLVVLTSRLYSVGRGRGIPGFTRKHYLTIVGLSYLQGFLAWEQFLEDAFILYLLGKKSPSGFCPSRYAFPPNRSHALDIAREDRPFADWTDASKVEAKAKRYFKDGKPFYDTLRNRSNVLRDMKTIRNAIAHRSNQSELSFQSLVRRNLTYYPPDLTPGAFLDTVVPGSNPAQTYLEYYFEQLSLAAEEIVPRN